MSELEKPILLSMSLCDLVIRDQQTHKLSLINLFNELRAKHFPCTHPRLYVYLCLTNGRGNCEGTLSLVDIEANQVLARLSGAIAFRSPLQVVEMSFELNALAFPHPGTYRFEFLCDGEPVGARDLHVTVAPDAPAPKA